MSEKLKHPNLLIVLTTEKDYKHAKDLAKSLLKKKYAACVNLRELQSLFWWEGEIQESREVQLIIKTSQINFERLILEIKRLHTYNLPELIFWSVSSEENYENWIKEVLD